MPRIFNNYKIKSGCILKWFQTVTSRVQRWHSSHSANFCWVS